MAKRKQPKNPTKDDLPTNPEFQRFAAFTGALIQVPKIEIDALIAAERAAKEHPDCEDEPALEC